MNLQDPGLFHYLFLLFLLLLSGFFSGAEVALVSLSPAKVKSLAQQNKSGAASVQQLKHQPERLLITILIGNNVVNILIPVLSTIIFTSLFGNKILGIMTGLLTLAILIFGEILPKTIAQRYAVGFSLFSAPLIEFFSKILFPLIWLLERLTKMAAPTQWSQAIFSDSELIALAEIGEEEGHLDPEERERIENVLEFGDTTVDEVMTPRTEMEVVYDTATINETVSAFLNSSYSRLPVCHESKDKVTGVLMLKQVLLAQAGYGDDTQISSIPTQHPLFVPTAMPLESVFGSMKQQITHLAVVIDEHGGTAGIVTMEDLLEEIFGEIQDETDEEVFEIRKAGPREYIILGSTEVEKITQETGWPIPADDNDTIAKVVLDNLGRFPDPREHIQLTDELTVIVEKMKNHRIDFVRFCHSHVDEEQTDPPPSSP